MNKDITPKNEKNQPHGYWEIYCKNKLRFKCIYINGKENGFEEVYWDEKLTDKYYHL